MYATLSNPSWDWDCLSSFYSKADSSSEVMEDAKQAFAIDDCPAPNRSEGPVQTSFGNNNHLIGPRGPRHSVSITV